NGSVVAARVAAGMAERLTGPGEGGSIFSGPAAREAFAQEAYASAESLWAEENVAVRYVLTASGEQDDDAVSSSGFSQSVPGMSTMFVLFTVLGGLGLLLEERKQWTLQRLAVMPISRAQILGGKILARFTTGILQFGILFAVGLVVGLDFGHNPLALLLIIVAYTLCITALTFTLATFVRTEMQAGGLVTLLALVLAALGGAWWPLEIVPDFMRVVAHISPVAWAMDGFSALLFYGGGLADVLLPVAVLLAAAGAFFAFGISRFSFD
ncbi:MAG: ABC transporter permease, partial [Anaerolineae bacterium]|nr:ABC transporter permease [Anaerolineae bacterium]